MTASEQITAYIDRLGDWRGMQLGKLRRIIREAAPELVEDWKWNTPVWSCNGNVLAVGAFRDHVKVNVFKGAALTDRHRLFNAGLEAKTSRSIDLHKGDVLNESALKALIRSAVDLNTGKASAPTRAKTRRVPTKQRQG